MSLGLSRLRLGLGTQSGVTAAFGVSFTGLTDGEARIGDHASISYTTDPVSATETVKWSNSSNPADAATYGTGASPTDYTAGDEGQLWLHVTDGGETVSRSAPIRYAPGTASAVADAQTFTVDSAITPIDASASGANLTFTYALSGAPAGVSINPTTGSITGTPSAASSGTATITATDQYGRTLQDTFTFTASLRTQATAADGLGPFNWTVDDTTVNVDATTDFTANGNTLTYTATGLPAGVTIATNGIISGTPTAASSGGIVITGQDEYGRETTSTTSHTTALRTQATGGTDLDLSFAEDSAISSTDLKANWTTNGNTLTYAITGTALPTGLSVSSAGVMTGTPTDVTADATYTLRGTDEYGRTTDDTFTLEITAAASGFTPAGLFSGGDNGVWYDVHPDYCYTDAGKTTNATVGDAVYVLEDRSGKGNDATQASASSRPVLRQDANSNYYLEFDGIDDVMTAPSAAWVSLSGYSAFFVGSHDEPTASIAYIFCADDTVRLSQFLRLKADTGVGVSTIPFNTSASAFTASTGVAARNTIYVAGAVCDGTSATARLDGVAGTPSPITGTIQTASEPLQIAARISTETEIHFYNGVLINRGLSSGEISDLETWLADKGNVTL